MPESGGTGEMEDPNDGGTTTPAQTDPSTLPETLTIAYLGSPGRSSPCPWEMSPFP